MTEEMKKQRVRQALDRELAFLNTTPMQRQRVFSGAVGERKMNQKGLRLSFGLVLALILTGLTLTAFAVGLALSQYYAKVAEMDADGALIRWELKDKIEFVNLMQSSDFDMNQEDFARVNDETLPPEEREAAADKIIDDRYGKLIREQIGVWDDMGLEVAVDSTGMAPDAMIIFKEHYLTEHPQGLHSMEDWMDFTDALGYYLRDEYEPAYAAARGENQYSVQEKPVVDEAYAVSILRGYMTEVLDWDADAVEEMEPDIQWNGSLHVWRLSGAVPMASMEKSQYPVTKGKNIEITSDGLCRLTLLVDDRGHHTRDTLDMEQFYRDYWEEPERLARLSLPQGQDVARAAVQEKYGLSDAELNRLFLSAESIGVGEEKGELWRMQYHTHYAYNQEPMYAALVNMQTGQAEAVYSYQLKDLPPAWTVLDFAARKEREQGWYSQWSPADKEELVRRLEEAGLMDKVADDQEPDGAVAAAFGAKGYPSALNVTVMAHALLGPEEAWDEATRDLYGYLRNKYAIHSQDALSGLNTQDREVTGEAAADIVKRAACRAWEMPEGSLDAWETRWQLQQVSFLNQTRIFYQVFLTRPREDTADTFSGKQSMTYRVLLDGTVADASLAPGWYSPAQDRAVTEERALYDGESWQLFNRYAQKHGLMLEYPDFFHWPMEHKASCAEELQPILRQKELTDPRLLAFLAHAYGLPGKDDLSLENAQRMARVYAKKAFELNDQAERLMRPACVFFDVTNPKRPFWKFAFSFEQTWAEAREAGLNAELYYAVTLDARTGEFLAAFTYGPQDGQTGLDAWQRWF